MKNAAKCSNNSILFLINHVPTQLKFFKYSASVRVPEYWLNDLFIAPVAAWRTFGMFGLCHSTEFTHVKSKNGTKQPE